MKMHNISRQIARTLALVAASAALSVVTASCDSVIYDDEGDCTPHYKVGFRFARNILNTDAFGSQVTDVSLYLFDRDGKLVYSTKEHRALTDDNTYYIDVDVAPGTYNMVAWCSGESSIDGHTAFAIGGGDRPGAMSELTATLPVESDADGSLHSTRDINRLYHGMSTDVVFPDSYGDIYIDPIMLTKDTNHITIQLVNSDGSAIEPKNVSVEIDGKNAVMDHTNTPVDTRRYVYRPWAVKGLATDMSGTETRVESVGGAVRASATTNGMQVELTTGRLMADVPQTLTVRRRDTGETMIKIPLIDYLLLVRSEYEAATSNQDYLDRFDDYSMTFFMQQGYTWIKSSIIINGWRRVPPQEEEV